MKPKHTKKMKLTVEVRKRDLKDIDKEDKFVNVDKKSYLRENFQKIC